MPRSKEKFEEMREKSKGAIEQAALKLFSTKGYFGTSTSAIAKEAGVAAGLMYNYYGSKEELLVSIINRHFQEMHLSLARQFEGMHPGPDAAEIIDALIDQIQANSERWQLLISIMFQPGISQTCKSQVDHFFVHQTELFESCFITRGIANPKENAAVLWAVLHGALLNYAASGNFEELMLLRRTIVRHIVTEGIV